VRSVKRSGIGQLIPANTTILPVGQARVNAGTLMTNTFRYDVVA
jgi:hypothetical protein